jgi:hypothetical protein
MLQGRSTNKFSLPACCFTFISYDFGLMEALYNILIPKTLKKQTSRDDRLRIETLYFDAGFTLDQIALQLNLTKRQIQYALSHQLTPQNHIHGRKVFLNTPQRKRLIELVTASGTNRRIPWSEIPAILGWNCGEKAIRKAFQKDGFVRRCARRKPPLSDNIKGAD